MTTSLAKIEKTNLWKSTLGNTDNEDFKYERERLRQTFISFREKVTNIVAQISGSVPGLTKHDISHLDALWETASLICGENYPINPLEGFILAGAILLHDAALCFEAYDNGIDGIRKTVTWKDIYKSFSDEDGTESKIQMADFTALRALHAEQAPKLIEKSWKLPDKNQEIYLIDDSWLRINLGPLIGKIAASHHWDIEKLSVLKTQINAISGFPSSWQVNAIKIACILRCADAAHINNERAPDFLYALLKRGGISFRHWQSQNRIAGPASDCDDKSGETLIYTSTRPFIESEAKSWWVAYDLLTLLNQEIDSCNNFLTSLNLPDLCFKIKKIKGIGSPETLKNYIEVDGWNPINAKVHVSNIEKLVTNLGGEQLYGVHSNKFEICLRELIQNCRDSIKARSIFDSDFDGRILIRVLQENDSQYLIVEDNGLGMSERVLTGSLLDFGTSFWTSSLVHSEFPGLLSSEFKSVGRFGIGFYSVFMIAKEVLITTKPWTGGVDQTMQLHFENGVSLRPIFKRAIPTDFKIATNCQIKIKLKENLLKDDLTYQTIDQSLDKTEFKIPLTSYISRLCIGLDTSVYFSDNKTETKVHEQILSEKFDVKNWLHSISYSKYQPSTIASEIIDNEYQRLRPIYEGNQLVGFAALSVKSAPFLMCSTIGGLGMNVLQGTTQRYLGFIEKKLSSAKREDGNEYLPSNSTLSKWAIEQLQLIGINELDISAKSFLMDSVCHFGANPINFAQVLVKQPSNYITYSIPELIEVATNHQLAFFRVFKLGLVELQTIPSEFEDCVIIQPMGQGEFFNFKFDNDEPENNFSLISQLHNGLIKLGKTPKWEFKRTDFVNNFYNQPLEAIILSCF